MKHTLTFVSLTWLAIEAGWFPYASGGVPDDNWDKRFTPPGVNSTVAAVAVSGDDVYVGGTFTSAGGINAANIARWNRHTGWSALGSGVNTTVLAIAIYGPDVYVGGMFTNAGGVSASRIARWNGTNWLAVGSGVNGEVRARGGFRQWTRRPMHARRFRRR